MTRTPGWNSRPSRRPNDEGMEGVSMTIHFSDAHLATMKGLYEGGRSLRELGAMFDCSYARISDALVVAGVKARGRGGDQKGGRTDKPHSCPAGWSKRNERSGK